MMSSLDCKHVFHLQCSGVIWIHFNNAFKFPCQFQKKLFTEGLEGYSDGKEEMQPSSE